MFVRSLNEHWIWKRRVRVLGHLFRAPTLDRLAALWLHKLGLLGRGEIKFLRRFLRRGMTVIDIGANQGLYTLLLANLVSPGRVFAFEPQPCLYQQLVSNAQANRVGNLVCHNLAVSRTSGLLTLQPGSINWGDNRVVTGAVPTAGQIKVEAISLDEKFAHRKIDFLKVDVQGWEAEVFLGARRMLQDNQDLVVMFEIWPYGLLKAGSPPEVLLGFLRDLGLQIWQLRNGSLANFHQNDLPDPRKELSYCNLVGARNPLLVKHLVG
jgi:FkbM family methyltransferase